MLVAMLPGVKICEIRKIPDERGFFAEVFRGDWEELLSGDSIVQANLSMTYPGIVRAWHRHNRGQVDYFVILRGALKICAFDDRPNSATKSQLDEIVTSSEKLRVVRIPGIYWHGTKALGSEPALLLYLVNRVYDYVNPDEERRPWNDPGIVPTAINGRKDDPRVGKPWDWNYPPHK